MKFQHLLALSLGLTIAIAPSITIAQTQPVSIATNTDQLPVPKLKIEKRSPLTLDGILQDEASWLARKPSPEREEKLFNISREFLAYLLESEKFGSNVAVPSAATASYFADLIQKYPKSSLIAQFHARSVDGELINDGKITDDRKIISTYDNLFAKYPNDPTILTSYRNYMLDNASSLPTSIRRHLTDLHDRAIARDPQNLSLYLGRAKANNNSAEAVLAQWKETTAKLPSNPAVGAEFTKLLLNSLVDRDSQLTPKVTAEAIAKIESALQRHPIHNDLYNAYGSLQSYNKTIEKAIPVLQAGLTKGADRATLNAWLGGIALQTGNEPQALKYFQQSISESAATWCNLGGSIDKEFKNPANQRAILRLIISALAANGSENCISRIDDIAFNTPTGQQMPQEIITALTPIAQSKTNFELSNLLLKLMRQQGQFKEITTIGPKLLPANGVELDAYQLMMAENIPSSIAQAHEKLGNWQQSAKFYDLLNEYHKGYPKMMTDRGTSYIASWHLGNLAWKQKKAPEAIALLMPVTTHRLAGNTALMEDGSEVSYQALAHNRLGEIFQSQGKKAEAKQQFEAAIKASAKFQTPKDNLAKLK